RCTHERPQPREHRHQLRHRHRPRRGQGDDERGPRLHRSWRGCIRPCHGDGPTAVHGSPVTDLAPLLRAAPELIALCTERGLTIATAESCTGGLIAAILTEVPGSSAVLERGF